MRFTADEAFEATEDGEPIMLSIAAANRMIDKANPGDDRADFWAQHQACTEVDAAAVLAWLGY